ADLCAVLRGQHSDSALACSDARGESRLPAAMDKLFAHPLIEGGAGLSDANQMLVSICGGPDLTMRDVNHVMEQLGRQAPQANLTLGASVQADFHERIAITIVASGFAAKRAPEGDSVQVSPGVIVSLSTPPTVASESDPLLREADLSKESRPPSRFVAPPPESAPELVQAMARQPGLGGLRKPGVWKQGTLNLEIISRGRFERSEPTIYGGEDLDVPTFVRRGITLN
ncbi:MAG: hypothetical protein FJ405_15315, partial [Verrucomicrobia bacterium]|nr:hypothetical protein [Verrucomicrobiota bacterium]